MSKIVPIVSCVRLPDPCHLLSYVACQAVSMFRKSVGIIELLGLASNLTLANPKLDLYEKQATNATSLAPCGLHALHTECMAARHLGGDSHRRLQSTCVGWA